MGLTGRGIGEGPQRRGCSETYPLLSLDGRPTGAHEFAIAEDSYIIYACKNNARVADECIVCCCCSVVFASFAQVLFFSHNVYIKFFVFLFPFPQVKPTRIKGCHAFTHIPTRVTVFYKRIKNKLRREYVPLLRPEMKKNKNVSCYRSFR